MEATEVREGGDENDLGQKEKCPFFFFTKIKCLVNYDSSKNSKNRKNYTTCEKNVHWETDGRDLGVVTFYNKDIFVCVCLCVSVYQFQVEEELQEIDDNILNQYYSFKLKNILILTHMAQIYSKEGLAD